MSAEHNVSQASSAEPAASGLLARFCGSIPGSVANRERTLQAGAWVFVLAVIGGVLVLGYRAWVRHAEQAAAEKRTEAEPPAPAVDAGSPKGSVTVAVTRCKEAIATSLAIGEWKATLATCREAEQEARGNREMAALTEALRCHEWRLRAGLAPNADDPDLLPTNDAKLKSELTSWIAKDCPPAALETMITPIPEEQACALRIEKITARTSRSQLVVLQKLSRLPEACLETERAKALFSVLRPEVTEDMRKSCQATADSSEAYALRMCRTYVALKYCPDLSVLFVPKGKKLQLDGRLKANGWRPDDPLLVLLLKKTPPDQRTWSCAKSGLELQAP
jgi:hypothetical protein